METNRRHSLSSAPSSLADAATADATTPLSTLLERKKQIFGRAAGQVEQKQLWPCSKWMTAEILSAPEKEFVLLSFMPIKLLSGRVLVYGVMTIWPTCLAR